jgi:hypothetical protein
MIDATVMVFDRQRASWDWEEAFPAVPRIGEALCFEDEATGADMMCRISEVWWRCGEDQPSLLVVADVKEINGVRVQ